MADDTVIEYVKQALIKAGIKMIDHNLLGVIAITINGTKPDCYVVPDLRCASQISVVRLDQSRDYNISDPEFLDKIIADICTPSSSTSSEH